MMTTVATTTTASGIKHTGKTAVYSCVTHKTHNKIVYIGNRKIESLQVERVAYLPNHSTKQYWFGHCLPMIPRFLLVSLSLRSSGLLNNSAHWIQCFSCSVRAQIHLISLCRRISQLVPSATCLDIPCSCCSEGRVLNMDSEHGKNRRCRRRI